MDPNCIITDNLNLNTDPDSASVTYGFNILNIKHVLYNF